MKSLRNIDLNLLVVFETIYASGNISQSARDLGLTQPSVSNALSRLRDTFDDPLFVRSGRGVIPTPKAQTLIEPVQHALNTLHTVVHQDNVFDPAISQREFTLHMFDTLEPIVMPHLVEQALLGDGVSFKLMLAPAISLEDAIETGKADICIGISPSNRNDLRWEIISPLDIVIIARKGHPEISGSITAEKFQSIEHVSMDFSPGANANIKKLRMKQRVERRDVVKVVHTSSIPILVANTDLVGMVNREYAERMSEKLGLQIIEPPFELNSQSIYAIWHNRNSQDSGIIWLREQINIAFQKKTENQ
ncbi:MAG: LysR family transcriptional regulator [Hyphomicrobiales bacterium]